MARVLVSGEAVVSLADYTTDSANLALGAHFEGGLRDLGRSTETEFMRFQ